MKNEPDYPLGQHALDSLHTATGLALDQVTLEAVAAGRVTSEDLRIASETLRMQAAIAERVGFKQFAQNLLRGAELVKVPESEILRVYEALRPRRSTQAELSKLADELERQYGAVRVAAMLREAAEAYAARGLTRGDHQ